MTQATVTYNAKADQWRADCECAGWTQYRADLAAAEAESAFNRSRAFDFALVLFGFAVGVAVVMP